MNFPILRMIIKINHTFNISEKKECLAKWNLNWDLFILPWSGLGTFTSFDNRLPRFFYKCHQVWLLSSSLKRKAIHALVNCYSIECRDILKIETIMYSKWCQIRNMVTILQEDTRTEKTRKMERQNHKIKALERYLMLARFVKNLTKLQL